MYAALAADGSVVTWGVSIAGTPRDGGYTRIAITGDMAQYGRAHAMAALKEDGSIVAWGDAVQGGSGAPAGTGYTQLASTSGAFTALSADGTLKTWGNIAGDGPPARSGLSSLPRVRA